MNNWEVIASVATALGVGITAVGVLIGVWQIRESRKISQATFEDSLDRQYREIAYGIPVDALIGKEIDFDKDPDCREWLYNYLDISNEQAYLRSKNKISTDTWKEWCRGIQAHLQKPAFRYVWEEVKSSTTGSFSYLERLEKSDFNPTK